MRRRRKCAKRWAALLLALLSLLMVWGELSGAAAAAPQEPGVVDGA